MEWVSEEEKGEGKKEDSLLAFFYMMALLYFSKQLYNFSVIGRRRRSWLSMMLLDYHDDRGDEDDGWKKYVYEQSFTIRNLDFSEKNVRLICLVFADKIYG